ncbi:RnfH family protein [Variovorax sp. HJSM1_2]|uniref:RnfH family protein n=1 Tax=Variovorax sp. HJSM1_2 TaxID=3366263 RepID=UPI003BCFF115
MSKGLLQVVVAYSSAPQQVVEQALVLPAGAKVADALAAAGLAAETAACAKGELQAGVWGRAASLQKVLHDGDRVEVYRKLRVDPKVARRERFASQGARGAGLFAKRRVGGKAGY